MAIVAPFAAFRYDAQKVGGLENVLTQPYDKITPAMQERYSRLNPCNLITVEKGKTTPHDTPQDNVYTRAAAALDQWIAQGVLVRDPKPAIYVYSQEYDVPHSEERKVRRGFIALGRVEDYSAGVVFRHEQTLSAPKADRLELLRATRQATADLRLRFWRDPGGPEVDWIVVAGDRWLPVEVKWSGAPGERDVRHLRTFLAEYPQAREAIVVCRTPRRFKIDANITAVPWQGIPDLVAAAAS